MVYLNEFSKVILYFMNHIHMLAANNIHKHEVTTKMNGTFSCECGSVWQKGAKVLRGKSPRWQSPAGKSVGSKGPGS